MPSVGGGRTRGAGAIGVAAPTAGKTAGYTRLFHSGSAAILAEIAAILAAERGETVAGWVRALLGDQVFGHDASGSDVKIELARIRIRRRRKPRWPCLDPQLNP